MVFVSFMTLAVTAGCESVNMKRFAPTTRIDMRLNPGWHEYDSPFESQVARLRTKRHMTCDDPEAIRAVYEKLLLYADRWANYWAIPPESPPVVLIFHDKGQWLGTLDLYPAALGHVHNLIRRIAPEDAAGIVEILCDCEERRANEG